MGTHLAVVQFPGTSALPSDRADMDFAIDADVIGFTGFTTAIDAVVNTAYATFSLAGSFFGDQVARGTDVGTIDFYDLAGALDGSAHGSPIETRSFDIAAAGGARVSLPSEVSFVVSFNADLTGIPEEEPNPSPPPATIRPRARRRGRVYIPYLATTATGDDGNGVSRPGDDFWQWAQDAWTDFMSTMLTTSSDSFFIWSRASAAFYPVVGGHVDNAWDTQRRRGEAPTTRASITP